MKLATEAFGDPADPTILLLSGMSASMDWWDDELCERLAAGGRHVVRYDHRDTGASPTCPPGAPDYTGDDLTADAVGVLDDLGVERAHLVGISMGGGIAQELGALHADRVRTITLIATTAAGDRSGDDELPGPTVSEWPDDLLAAQLVLAPNADEARVRAIVERVEARSIDMRSAANHELIDHGTATFRLADIAVPTLVVHGSVDPMFPLPHGEMLAREIPGATLLVVDGMGHEVPPPPSWDVVVPAILRHTA